MISMGTTFLRTTYDHLSQDLVTSDKLVSRWNTEYQEKNKDGEKGREND